MMKLYASVLSLAALVGCAQSPGTDEASDTKIVGGTKVTATDPIADSTVALVLPNGKAFCTGSLIAPRIVVTASHCIEGYDEDKLYVAFGLVAKTGHYASARLRTATQAVMHPDYDTVAMDEEEASSPPNDIALLVLNADAPAGYDPVAALTTSTSLQTGEMLTLAGFGLTSAYQGGTSGVLRKVDVKLTGTSTVAKEIEFGNTPGKSACMGDSGGPAFVKRGGKLVLVGVTSRGSRYCDSSGIYTDIRYFSGWLANEAEARL